jgi:exodeoxyribonuclease V beta subunit
MSVGSSSMVTLDVAEMPLTGLQLIEASAGTGKTHAITSLYLRLLLERGLGVADILVVTFTRAATEELRGRIRRRLVDALRLLTDADALAEEADAAFAAIVRRARGEGAANARRLRAAIAAIDEAAIFTIHGFCQRALRDHAFESGQTFTTELTESERELVATVVTDWWRRTFYADPGLASLAAARKTLATPQAVLDWLGEPLTRSVEIVRVPPVDRAGLAAGAERLPAQWQVERAGILAAIDACKELSRGKEALMAHERALRSLDAWSEAGGLAPPGDASALTQERLDERVTDARKKKGVKGPQIPFAAALGGHLAALDALEPNLLRDALVACREALDRIKRRANLMAFDDLIRRLRDALRGAGGPWLAAQIAARYRVALIDEFQDTDPLQFEIFERIYRDREDTGLLMIGDPKQAIYSFRGADIHAYVRAKRETSGTARHTLGTNWRSTSPLVAGVNALFGRLDDPFLFADDIGFARVAAAGRADAEPLLIDGEAPVPLRFWVPDGDGTLGSVAYREASARAVATACVGLLRGARTGAVTLAGEPLRPRDVAVLVRSGREAAQIQQALRAAGIGSAVNSRDSVFAAEEAGDLATVLDAVLDPPDERRLRRALASPLWGVTAPELDALLRDEAAWEDRVSAFWDYRRTWTTAGFMPMFRRWLRREGIAARLLARPAGERTVTNLLHLAELLQQAAREHATPEALCQWLADQMAGKGDLGEVKELRLESDENLVQIVTQHKSKGLEYPVVFLPFAALATRGGKDPLPLFHDPAADDRLVLDCVDQGRALAQAERERLAEDLRLLYVSLTRATHLCVLSWGAVVPRQNYVYPALAHLLHAEAGQTPAEADAGYQEVRAQGHAAIRRHLQGIAAACPEGIAVEPLPAETDRLAPIPADTAAFRAEPVHRLVVDAWGVTSYSELARLSEEGGAAPAATATAADAQEPAPETIAAFPRGRRAGVCFHAVLEELDFAAGDAGAVHASAQAQLRRAGLDEAWAPVLAAGIGDVLATPLGGGLRLRDLAPGQRRSEVGFCYPIHRLSGAGLLRAVPSLEADELATPRFTFSPRSGLMKGFVDLVFAHEGRYYLADWKTNWLGPTPEHYTAERIAAEMRRHHYDLQYYVYAVALHRHLASRLPDYDYERHLGGVYYLFVRGMTPAMGMERGVFFDRPAAATIGALDALFAGRAP